MLGSNTQEIETYNGRVLRLMFLMTHYRQPLNFNQQKLDEAHRIFAKFIKAAEPNNDAYPEELIEALCDDLNTPKAIAVMHVYCKKDPKKLFASLKFLGLI